MTGYVKLKHKPVVRCVGSMENSLASDFAYYEIVGHQGYMNLTSPYLGLKYSDGSPATGLDYLVVDEPSQQPPLWKQAMNLQMGKMPTQSMNRVNIRLREIDPILLSDNCLVTVMNVRSVG